jgi:fructoselysine 6-kinase
MAAVGDNCLDVYLAPIRRSAVGGNAVNVAVRWAREGQPSRYLGAVADDAAGRRVVALVRREVPQARIAVVPGLTGVTKIALTDTGDRRLVDEEFGVSGEWVPPVEEIRPLADCAWVHCTLPTGPGPVRDALPRGVPISYDLSTRHHDYDVSGLAIAFLSWHGRPDRDAAQLAQAIVDRGAACAVVTCGRHGSLAYDGEEVDAVDAQSVAPVDTLGAGDAYIARFIIERVAGRELWQAMESATEAATEACTHLGGFPQELELVPQPGEKAVND